MLKTESEAKKEILASKWSVKAVKTMKGHDGGSVECTLCKDNKKVATVYDDSWGGGYQYTWLKDDAKKEFGTFAESFTVVLEYAPEGLQYNKDCVVGALVADYTRTKKLKSVCKKKAAFTLKDDKDPDNFWTLNVPYSPAIKTYLVKKYGENLKEILNETI